MEERPEPRAMVNAPYIPKRTQDELSASHPEGTRHAAIIKIAMSLLGNGLPKEAVFATIRPQFDADKTDREIRDVIDWCQAKNPKPSVANGNGQHRGPFPTYTPKPEPKKITKETCLQTCGDFLSEESLTVERFCDRSEVKVGELPTQSALLLESLYATEERINVVCDYTVNEKGKANPRGGGKTLTRQEWLAYFSEKGAPSSKAGAWVRPNPCGEGTGADGAIRDDDITHHRFMLLESDSLPLEMQLSLYAKFRLPIAAVMLSGGDSAHAWVKLEAASAEVYRAIVKRVLDALLIFGFDQSNKNPSRLSRLPGVKREIGASGTGEQRLLLLAPAVEPLTEEALTQFEQQVRPPFTSRLPLLKTARDSIGRYEELYANRGRTGVMTGLPSFDRDSGGLKRGNLIVLAAETNVGKSSLALNIINRALHDGRTTALFTLEMDRDEIWDLLVSMNLKVSRNVFNTGQFTERDQALLTNGSGKLARLPLHIFDDPGMTVEDIEAITLRLAGEHNLQLVVVDYLQLVLPPVFFRDNREQQVAHIGRTLRMLAKKAKVPVIAVSQLNEEGKIRESRAVAHDAHIVFMLGYDTEGLKLRITKGRSVPKKTYPMYFEGEYCLMQEASKIQENYDSRQAMSEM